jgi:hypothetical protein
MSGGWETGDCQSVARRAHPRLYRPEPAVQRFLVRLQNIRAQPKTGVKKRLIILVGGVEILNQAQ